MAAQLRGSALLRQRNALGARAAEALERLNPSDLIIIGGSDTLAQAVQDSLSRLHPVVLRVRIVGQSRIATAALAARFGQTLVLSYSASMKR